MLEPVPNAEKVFYVSLEEDLSKVATDLGLGLLPDEMEKVKDYFKMKEESLPMLNFKPLIKHGLNIAAINLRNLF